MANTIALMRQRVLDMAIRGELVEQREEEGTAEELYSIIEEREKSKKNQNLLEIDVKKSPFTIPKSWKWVRLSEIGTIIGGGTPKTNIDAYWIDGDIPWVSPADLTNYKKKYISQGRKSITQLGLEKSSARLMDTGAVLFSSRAPIGYAAIAENPISTNQGFKSVVPCVMEMNEYIYYYFFAFIDDIKSRSSGTTFKEISGRELGNSLFPLPPLNEQKRIVAKIEEIFAIIDKIGTRKEEASTIINKMRQTALQDAIKGVLVEQDETDEPASELYKKIQIRKEKLIQEKKIKKEKSFPDIAEDEIPFEIPDSWEWVRLGEVGQTNIGLTYRPTDKSENGTIVLRSSNIQNGKIDYSDIVRVDLNIPEAKKCEIGDLLICARNGSKRLVGKAALVDEEGHSFGAFMANYRSEFNQYIYYYMNSNFFRSLLGESGTTTINQITQSMLKGFILPLPPFAEQERIVAKLDEITAICNQMEAILNGSSEISESLKVV